MQRFSPGRSWQSALTAVGSVALLFWVWGSVAFADATVTVTEGSPTDINTWAFAPAEVTITAGGKKKHDGAAPGPPPPPGPPPGAARRGGGAAPPPPRRTRRRPGCADSN